MTDPELEAQIDRYHQQHELAAESFGAMSAIERLRQAVREELVEAKAEHQREVERCGRQPLWFSRRTGRGQRPEPNPAFEQRVDALSADLERLTARLAEVQEEAQPLGELVSRLRYHLRDQGLRFDAHDRVIRPLPRSHAQRDFHDEYAG